MIAIIQRVSQAKVTVDNRIVGQIEQGILALVAVEKDDCERQVERMLERICTYRIFADQYNRMNLSLRDIEGDLLLVPQFTLAADTRKGCRPSFTAAADPDLGQKMFDYMRHQAEIAHQIVQFGCFGADMKVHLINDGPVTFTLKT